MTSGAATAALLTSGRAHSFERTTSSDKAVSHTLWQRDCFTPEIGPIHYMTAGFAGLADTLGAADSGAFPEKLAADAVQNTALLV